MVICLKREELVELSLEESFVWELGLVLGDQGWGQRAAEGIFNDFVILSGTEQEADTRVLMRLLYIAVKGFEVKVKLPEVSRFKAANFQLNGDEGIEFTMIEKEVDREVLVAYLEGVLGADEAEVAPEFGEESAEMSE